MASSLKNRGAVLMSASRLYGGQDGIVGREAAAMAQRRKGCFTGCSTRQLVGIWKLFMFAALVANILQTDIS